MNYQTKPYFKTHTHQTHLNDKPWIEARLTEEEMNFLNQAILDGNRGENMNKTLAGNISKSEAIKDKDNWFFETVLKKLISRVCSDEDFEMDRFWVNYQKQHEFNPLHNHSGIFSFVVFMKIPTDWKEQHSLPFIGHANTPCASDFAFVWSKEDTNKIFKCTFPLSPKDEGRMLFFPAWLEHTVHPFYGTEEERVTISGNIRSMIEFSF
mgnify:CR=1 FL=1